MQFNLEGIKVNSEKEFIELIDQLNTDIKFDNYFKRDKPKEKLLDKKYLIERYRTLAAKEIRNAFREEHDCKYCFYYENKTCSASGKCPIEEQGKKEKRRISERLKCARDKEGNCPYGNEVGTCFGYCWKKILDKHYEKNQNRRKNGGTKKWQII